MVLAPPRREQLAAAGRGGQINTHAVGLAFPCSRDSLGGGFYKDLHTLQSCVGERGLQDPPQTRHPQQLLEASFKSVQNPSKSSCLRSDPCSRSTP